MLVFKGLINCLFLLMQVVIILLMKIYMKNIFFQGFKIRNYNIEIDGIDFYNQLINGLINMMKSEKYQQDKVMIILMVVY